MSKNSPIQNYEAAKAYAQSLENRRKRSGKTITQKPKFKKRHPVDQDED
jgi:hypothetical protein